MEVYGYLRVSGKGQIEGDGFERQENAIKDLCNKNNWILKKIFKDKGISGTLEDRPALAELMVNLEQNGHGIKTVVIEKLDRFARDLMVQEAIIRDFQKHGWKLVSALEGSNLASTDPTRALIRQVFGSLAEYDKAMLVQKLKVARQRKKAKMGKCEGRKGYQETHPELIARVKQLNRKPRNKKKPTFQQIADTINTEGFKTQSGKQFTKYNIQKIIQSLK